ncbi:MAG: amino acid permease [Natrialbaceae archaeon]|nr:amino acid permease [Natrialbaceae archaeon]
MFSLTRASGPSIAIAMVLVSLPVALGMLGLLQVGGAMPAAGGSYVYASRLIHPFIGFLLPWLTIPVLWFGQVFLAYGFAEFVQYFFPTLPLVGLMYAVLIPFITHRTSRDTHRHAGADGLRRHHPLRNCGVHLPGAARRRSGNYTPLYTADGYEPFVVAMISLSIAMQGFNIVTDLGEELRNPVENIPRVLFLEHSSRSGSWSGSSSLLSAWSTGRST